MTLLFVMSLLIDALVIGQFPWSSIQDWRPSSSKVWPLTVRLGPHTCSSSRNSGTSQMRLPVTPATDTIEAPNCASPPWSVGKSQAALGPDAPNAGTMRKLGGMQAGRLIPAQCFQNAAPLATACKRKQGPLHSSRIAESFFWVRVAPADWHDQQLGHKRARIQQVHNCPI